MSQWVQPSEDRVIIFDTTLRDGEQAPGASMNLQQKTAVAVALRDLGVDVIELGFPIASPGDFEAVSTISRAVEGPVMCALARANRADIDRAAEALEGASRSRLHVFLATSPIHRQFKLKLAKEEIVRTACEAIRYGRERFDDLEFSAEDAARTELDFLCEVVERAIEAGATTINIPDTVGYAVPAQFAATIAHLQRRVRGIEKVVLSVHCHNDLGLAVANSLAALQEGARQVECTVNGIGERAGNCSLEEVVMALATRADYFRLHTGVRTEHLYPASRVVAKATGFAVQRNKAIVGQNAFAHEAGIHQHGILMHAATYEIMKPEDVGFKCTHLVLGKHSGRHLLQKRLLELGYHLDKPQVDGVFEAVKQLADKKKEIYDGDLEALVNGCLHGSTAGHWELVTLRASSDTEKPATAYVSLRNQSGRIYHASSQGDGPVDAAFQAIEQVTGERLQLRNYQVCSATVGGDAQGEVTLEVEHRERTYRGQGVSTDIVLASARAYLEVINRIASNGDAARRTANGSSRARSWESGEQPGESPVRPRTLFEKIWDEHLVASETPERPAVLYADLHLIHEVTSPQAFAILRKRGLRVRRPERTFATVDHSIPTARGADGHFAFIDSQSQAQVSQLEANCREFGIELHGLGSERQGIVHVIAPELGLTQPGYTVVCGDSHTSTHGAFGALAFGIGTTEVAHVLATQCLLQRQPRTLEVCVSGRLRAGVSAKDVILAVIGKIGVGGGTGCVIEYSGSAVRALSMEERMTICNMSIEAGARAGLISPDDTTFEYLARTPRAPKGAAWERALSRWRALSGDVGATFDRRVELDAGSIEPMITFGTHPGMSIPLTGAVPDPGALSEAGARAALEKALRYMGLSAGSQLLGHPVDVVFIGSCTNGRLSDLRVAASVMRGRKLSSRVRALVVPGSQKVKRDAEAEGLDRIFRDAGAEWREPGCSMCIAMNGDRLEPGQYAVSTTNRNFEGRQGPGGRTFLASPLTAAAAAIAGRIADPRELLR
jgi:3-isopropylmalate/(R)-2-methylmalate dehydratase large subunit